MYSDEISVTSGLLVSAVKQLSSGQCRTYTMYNISVDSKEYTFIKTKCASLVMGRKFIPVFTRFHYQILSWAS